MLKQVTEGVRVHQSDFMQSNAVIVQGRTGVLVVDPGITEAEITQLADQLDQPVVVGFSTHPHWDHLLWHHKLGTAPRYSTARCAADAKDFLSNPDWRTAIKHMLPPDIADQIPLDLIGEVSGLPAGTARLPWEGPVIHITEHRAHAAGHAALLIEEPGVLIAGDMLSDALIPMFDLEAEDPVQDYLDALELLGKVARKAKMVIPGHGSIGGADQISERLERDRAYVQAVRDGRTPDDPRLTQGPNKDWLPGVHKWQLEQLAKREG